MGDPIVLATLYMSAPLEVIVLLSIMLATFMVNAFANFVGPAYEIANTFPGGSSATRRSRQREAKAS